MTGIHFEGACTGVVYLLRTAVRDWLRKHWGLLCTALWVEEGTRFRLTGYPATRPQRLCSETPHYRPGVGILVKTAVVVPYCCMVL